jgi:hypothetical protein
MKVARAMVSGAMTMMVATATTVATAMTVAMARTVATMTPNGDEDNKNGNSKNKNKGTTTATGQQQQRGVSRDNHSGRHCCPSNRKLSSSFGRQRRSPLEDELLDD